MFIRILIMDLSCVRPAFSLGCDLKLWNFQCLLWAVFGSLRGGGGSSMGFSHSKAAVHSWEAAMALLLSSVSSSPPPFSSIKPQKPSSHPPTSHTRLEKDHPGAGLSWDAAAVTAVPMCWEPAGSQLRPGVPACIPGRSPPMPGGMPEVPQATLCASGLETLSTDTAQGIPLLWA